MNKDYRLLCDGLFRYLETFATASDLAYFRERFSIKPPKTRGETPLRSHQSHIKRMPRGGVRLTPEERCA